MSREPTSGLTYADLERMFPDEDLVHRELIDGELFVTPAPGFRHQRAVAVLFLRLGTYAEERGGVALSGPFDVLVSDTTVLEPDILYVAPEHVSRIEERFLPAPPDLVVEVSSPSTRRRDLIGKRDAYERFGVPEYWFVDLEERRVLIHRLEGGTYGEPTAMSADDDLESPLLPGFRAAISRILGD